jgi:GTP cyclohydrolase II
MTTQPLVAGPATIRARVPVTLERADGLPAELITFTGLPDPGEHLACVARGRANGGAPLVRVHSECLTGDVFGSARCDCGPQLDEALRRIAVEGGAVLYLRQEGRGIGLYNKLDTYLLQNEHTDNPDKARQLRRNGITVVTTVPTALYLTKENAGYLAAKAQAGGHAFPVTPEVPA